MIDKVVTIIKATLALVPFALLLGGCAGGLGDTVAQDRLEQARTAYNAAKADPQVEASASDLMLEANQALQDAEKSGNADEVTHLAYIAQKKVATARQITEGKMAERDLDRVNKQSAQILLQKRERQAMSAKEEAAKARQEAQSSSQQAALAKQEAEQRQAELEKARTESEQARLASQQAQAASEQAKAQSEQARTEITQLTQELSSMKTKETEQGLVVTLGDVLFETGKSDISPRAKNSLDKLADFLNNHPGRNLKIEGFTDSVGSDQTNMQLSEKRASAVKTALVDRGVSSDRIDIKGNGKANPVASNSTSHGRALNRRVEVIILNQGAAGGRVSPQQNQEQYQQRYQYQERYQRQQNQQQFQPQQNQPQQQESQ